MTQYVRLSTYVAGRAVVDPKTGNPTAEHLRKLNDNLRNLTVAINQIGTQGDDIEASLIAAGIALTTAEAAAAAIAAAEADRSLVNSYVDPNNILSSEIDAGDSSKRTIIISDHERVYGNGTTVAVDGATLNLAEAGTEYFIYYDDADFEGGTVTFVATTNPSAAVQGGVRHTVGSITTVASGSTTPTTGGGTTGPGIPYKPTGYELPE